MIIEKKTLEDVNYRAFKMIIKRKSNPLNIEIIKFYSLFLVTVFFVYYTSPGINRLYFLLLLFLFWLSKKDYSWFVFAFILIAKPALLFHGGLATDIHRIPFYKITTGVSFDFFDLFFITSFIKALARGKRTKLILRKPLIYLLLYLIFLFLISFFYGMNFELLTSSFRKFIVFTLFISFPYLVYKKEDFFKFIHLVFPIMFLIIFSQLLYLYTGNNLYSVMTAKGTSSIIQLQEIQGHSTFIRPMAGGEMLIFFSLIFSLFLIEKKDYPGKKSYLYIILGLSILSIFISATRSWIVMFAIILLLYSIFIVKKKARLLFNTSLIMLILFFSYLFIPRFAYSVDNTWRRVSTIEYLIGGDVTAGGTLQRIDKRLPKVLEGFGKNPIFGWGFSATCEKYYDQHVGNFNLLMQVGVVGEILFLYFWFMHFNMTFTTNKYLSYNNSFKSSILVLAIGFLGTLILHFTSFQFFGYSVDLERLIFIIIFISFSESFGRAALKAEMSKKPPDIITNFR